MHKSGLSESDLYGDCTDETRCPMLKIKTLYNASDSVIVANSDRYNGHKIVCHNLDMNLNMGSE